MDTEIESAGFMPITYGASAPAMAIDARTKRILVVDDDRAMCELIQTGLERRGFTVDWCTSGESALQRVADEDFDVVVSDIKLGDVSGLVLCRRIGENRPDLPVVVITAFGNMQTAVSAIRAGAYDFITKPIEIDSLEHRVARAIQHRELHDEMRRLKEEVDHSRRFGDLVGSSLAMKKVYELIERVGPSDATVLLTGESGTGKELVAQALHAQSESKGPFIAINCAAMPAALLESELFGHTRGAFTDAKNSHDGLFVQAIGGTLFLDEIGELPLDMQPKLLRAIQERRVRPIGATDEILVDVRIIAATNRDIEADVEAGRFREDLYYRIHVVGIHIPPLRSRGNDVLSLAQHFMQKFGRRIGKEVAGLTPPAAQKLLEYAWPGNVRELENCLERAVTLARGDQITIDDLPDKIREYESTQILIADRDPERMPTLEDLERRYIHWVLGTVGGNKTHAARVLGLDRRTLYRRLDRYQLSEGVD